MSSTYKFLTCHESLLPLSISSPNLLSKLHDLASIVELIFYFFLNKKLPYIISCFCWITIFFPHVKLTMSAIWSETHYLKRWFFLIFKKLYEGRHVNYRCLNYKNEWDVKRRSRWFGVRMRALLPPPPLFFVSSF